MVWGGGRAAAGDSEHREQQPPLLGRAHGHVLCVVCCVCGRVHLEVLIRHVLLVWPGLAGGSKQSGAGPLAAGRRAEGGGQRAEGGGQRVWRAAGGAQTRRRVGRSASACCPRSAQHSDQRSLSLSRQRWSWGAGRCSRAFLRENNTCITSISVSAYALRKGGPVQTMLVRARWGFGGGRGGWGSHSGVACGRLSVGVWTVSAAQENPNTPSAASQSWATEVERYWACDRGDQG